MNENKILECDDCHAPAGTVCSDMDCPGKKAQAPRLEHIAGTDCWCGPEAHYTDPQTGVTVWVHRVRH